MADFRTPKSKHPLWMRWLLLRRRDVLCDAWRDFEAFVAGVGDPGQSRKLARPDETQSYGPNNFRWTEPLEGARKVAYHREYHANYYPVQREKTLRKLYGIGEAEYQALYEAQGCGCAICGRSASEPTRRGGKKHKFLAVDHCHSTGEVRGLLCTDCNVGIGYFEDNPNNLVRAIAYLSRKVPKVA